MLEKLTAWISNLWKKNKALCILACIGVGIVIIILAVVSAMKGYDVKTNQIHDETKTANQEAEKQAEEVIKDNNEVIKQSENSSGEVEQDVKNIEKNIVDRKAVEGKTI